jgi:uracil-DNA glycosylase
MKLTRQETAASLIPEHYTLSELQEAAAGCWACPLWTTGTQTVFREGLPTSYLMLVGEKTACSAVATFISRPSGNLLWSGRAKAEVQREGESDEKERSGDYRAGSITIAFQL